MKQLSFQKKRPHTISVSLLLSVSEIGLPLIARMGYPARIRELVNNFEALSVPRLQPEAGLTWSQRTWEQMDVFPSLNGISALFLAPGVAALCMDGCGKTL